MIGIAEALELRRQGQEDDHQGEEEGQHQAARFLHELARRPGVVEAVAGRQRALGQLLQSVQRLALGHEGQGHALDGGRVGLLEMVDGLGLHRGVEVHDGGQRHHAAACGTQVIMPELVRIQAEALVDLRDDLVGAAAQFEEIHVAAAQHGRKRRADVLHVQAELCGHVAVDLDAGLRQVDAQVGLQEDELPGLLRILQELLRYVIKLVERLGCGDARTGSAGRGRPARAAAGTPRSASRRSGSACLAARAADGGGLGALIPGFEHHAADDLGGRIDLEHMVGFREALEYVVDLAGIELPLVDGGRRDC